MFPGGQIKMFQGGILKYTSQFILPLHAYLTHLGVYLVHGIAPRGQRWPVFKWIPDVWFAREDEYQGWGQPRLQVYSLKTRFRTSVKISRIWATRVSASTKRKLMPLSVTRIGMDWGRWTRAQPRWVDDRLAGPTGIRKRRRGNGDRPGILATGHEEEHDRCEAAVDSTSCQYWGRARLVGAHLLTKGIVPRRPKRAGRRRRRYGRARRSQQEHLASRSSGWGASLRAGTRPRPWICRGGRCGGELLVP